MGGRGVPAYIFRLKAREMHAMKLFWASQPNAFHPNASCLMSSSPVSCTSKQRLYSINSLLNLNQVEDQGHLKISARTVLQGSLNNYRNAHGGFRYSLLPLPNYSIHGCRGYSSNAYGNSSDKLPTEASAPLDAEGSSSDVSNAVLNAAKTASESITNSLTYLETKIKETSEDYLPAVQQWLDSSPYLKDIIIPASWTVVASLLAWLVMPRMLRKFHRYTEETSLALYLGRKPNHQIIYEKSFWGALEDPVRYLVTFLAISQLGLIIAPSTVSQYMPQIWRGAAILSVIWFLQRWKRNIFSRFSTEQMIDRDKIVALDKISSVALFVLGGLAFAEASGVAVQSVLTVGGVGGIAAAIAARDLLGNTITGLSLQLSQPFSVGDTIKAGSIEGKVIEIGLTTTTLLSPEKFPVIAPNSFLASQIIVNKSRAECHLLVSKVPIQVAQIEEVPKITSDIEDMLTVNHKVVFEPETPQCFVSNVGPFWELTVSCNVMPMSKSDLHSTKQQILLEAVKIIKKHGAEISSNAPYV